MEIRIPRTEEEALLKSLEGREDMEAARIKRYQVMPDLSRTPGSPLAEMVRRVKELPLFKDFDDIDIPEIVPASVSFDLFNFPADHPARSTSDTYYVDEKNILRTHDTVFWYYYLNHPEIRERLERKESMGTLCYGKVYRKDEIDRRHMNIFHQMGGWYIIPDSEGTLKLDDLKNVLSQIVKSIFGPATEFRFNVDTFPYTDPSLEVEVRVGDEWVEILGGGIVRKTVLAIISMKLPDIRLLWSADERVKKQLVLGNAYAAVSKYPPVVRDISFIVKKGFVPNNYFDLVRDVGGNLVEEVDLLDTYENDEKLGAGNLSYAYRITYRDLDRTLTSEEVNALHATLESATVKHFGATVR